MMNVRALMHSEVRRTLTCGPLSFGRFSRGCRGLRRPRHGRWTALSSIEEARCSHRLAAGLPTPAARHDLLGVKRSLVLACSVDIALSTRTEALQARS